MARRLGSTLTRSSILTRRASQGLVATSSFRASCREASVNSTGMAVALCCLPSLMSPANSRALAYAVSDSDVYAYINCYANVHSLWRAGLVHSSLPIHKWQSEDRHRVQRKHGITSFSRFHDSRRLHSYSRSARSAKKYSPGRCMCLAPMVLSSY